MNDPASSRSESRSTSRQPAKRQPQRALPSSASRRTLQLEMLEQRHLMSANPVSGFLGVPGLQFDPHAHSAAQILVRFRDDANPAGQVRGERLLKEANLWRVELEGKQSVTEALQRVQQRPDVLYAHPDYIVSTQAWYDAGSRPSDALYNCGMLWGLYNTGTYEGTAGTDVDAALAWQKTRGSGVIVAVIDTGVDYNHPDLAGSMWTNAAEIAGNGMDDDNNGFIDDIFGYNFVANNGNPMDDNGHGSHVAGTIAAVANNDPATSCNANNGVGMIGLAPEAKIMALKFLDSSGSGTTSNAIRAIEYAVKMGANISNNSYGGSPFEQAMLDAITAATNAGQLFIAAAGNGDRFGNGVNNDAVPFYPASYKPAVDAVISVAASTSSDTYATYSNYGATSVDLAAPGHHIWSTIPLAKDTADGTKDGYARKDGTSMAAPHVAATAALVWSINPGLTNLAVKDILLGSVEKITGRETVTNGRLNAHMAVTATPAASVLITSHANGSTMSGVTTLQVEAAAAKVDFLLDGAILGEGVQGTAGSKSWSYEWNTVTAKDGHATLTARATDATGQISTHAIRVVVKNTFATITSPASGSIVSGDVIITAQATDDDLVRQVEFFVDGKSIGVDTDASGGWSLSWNTSTVASGPRNLTAKATDRAGNVGTSATVAVNKPIAFDSFESNNYSGGTGWKSAWTVSGDVALLTADGPADGNYHTRLRQNTGYLRREVNLGTTSWTDVAINFSAKISSFENLDKGWVKVSTDGKKWTTVKEFTRLDSDNLYASYTVGLSRIATSFTRLFVLFDAEMNSTDDNWYIDRVAVTGRANTSSSTSVASMSTSEEAGLMSFAQTSGPAAVQSSSTLLSSVAVPTTGSNGTTTNSVVPSVSTALRSADVDRVFASLNEERERDYDRSLEELLTLTEL